MPILPAPAPLRQGLLASHGSKISPIAQGPLLRECLLAFLLAHRGSPGIWPYSVRLAQLTQCLRGLQCRMDYLQTLQPILSNQHCKSILQVH